MVRGFDLQVLFLSSEAKSLQGSNTEPLAVSMACAAMEPAFGAPSTWRFHHASLCAKRTRHLAWFHSKEEKYQSFRFLEKPGQSLLANEASVNFSPRS
jgi:hypothetical protein